MFACFTVTSGFVLHCIFCQDKALSWSQILMHAFLHSMSAFECLVQKE